MTVLRRIAAVVAAVLLAAPAAARAEWSEPFDVSLPGSFLVEAQVAVGPSGEAVAVWVTWDGPDGTVQARRIAADGTPGPILDVSQRGRRATGPDVAIDAAGNATVVWGDRAQMGTDEIVRARRLTAAGVLEPAVDLTGPGLSSGLPKVAVAPSGAATVVWFRRPGTIHMRRIDPVGGPGATLDLSPPQSASHDVAVDDAGYAHVVFTTYDGTDLVVQTRGVDPGGALDPIFPLSGGGPLAFSPQVALDANGVQTVAWVREDDRIELRRGRGTTVEVAPPGTAAGLGDLAVDANGDATVVWTGASGSDQAVFLRRVSAGGDAGPINDLWSGSDDFDPRLALDGDGVATLIWAHAGAAGGTIRTRTAPPGAPFGPIADLWPATPDEYVGNVRIAANAAGDMTAVWHHRTVDEEKIVAARWTETTELPPPPPPPEERPPAAPAPPPGPPAAPLPGDPPAVERCRVPRLTGLTLAQARKRIRRSGCRLGKVKKPRSARKGRRLVVKRATRRPGSTTIRLTMKWRRRVSP